MPRSLFPFGLLVAVLCLACTDDFNAPDEDSDASDTLGGDTADVPVDTYEDTGSDVPVDTTTDTTSDVPADTTTDTGSDPVTDDGGPECGNSSIDTGEDCDGDLLGGETCESLGYGGGVLGCTGDCTFDESDCNPCGNSSIDTGEDCDGDLLGGETCESLGYGRGDLSCTDECIFDESDCDPCGNDFLEGTEECDGSATAGRTCEDEGFEFGDLYCSWDCTWDTTGCFFLDDIVEWIIPDSCDSSVTITGTPIYSGVGGGVLFVHNLTTTSFSWAFMADDWPSGTIDTSKYFEFSVSAPSGGAIIYREFEFALYNNYGGTSDWEIRSSLDGYASALDSGHAVGIAASGQRFVADISDLGEVSGTVTFRFYTYNNTGSSYPLRRGFRAPGGGGIHPILRGAVLY